MLGKRAVNLLLTCCCCKKLFDFKAMAKHAILGVVAQAVVTLPAETRQKVEDRVSKEAKESGNELLREMPPIFEGAGRVGASRVHT